MDEDLTQEALLGILQKLLHRYFSDKYRCSVYDPDPNII